MEFTRADLGDFRVARARIDEFKKFILDRLEAYSKRPGATMRKIEGVHKRGWDYWIVDERTLWGNYEYVTCLHRLDDERAPTMTTETVNVPWAWVFGEIEADEDYQTYLRLKERFESGGN